MNTKTAESAAQVHGVVSRLNASDIAELRACKQRGYVTPRFNPHTGRMLASQWRSWQKLQRLGCGVIEGMGEAEDFSISGLGRLVLKSCGRRVMLWHRKR